MRWRFDRDELRLAVRSGDIIRVEAILEDQPEWADTTDGRGRSLLFVAAREGYNGRTTRLASLIQVLLDAGATVGPIEAVVLNQPQIVAELLAEEPGYATARDVEGQTPVHHAAARGVKDCMALLLGAGGDATAADLLGRTPLDLAVETGPWKAAPAVEVVRVLEEAGARMTLESAVALDEPGRLVRLLEDSAGGLERQGRRGGLLLHCAVRHGSTQALQTLLDAGADPNACDQHGRTPLIEAVRLLGEQELGEVVRRLLHAGADLSVRDGRGMRAADYASALGRKRAARVLSMLTG